MSSAPPRVHAALIAVSTIYGFFFVAVKLLLQDLTQMEVILARFVLTAILVALLEWRLFRSRFESVQQFLQVLGLGILGVFLVQSLLVLGVHRTTAFHSALIMSTIPILTVFFSMLLGYEAFNAKKVVGTLVAFCGVAMLLFIKSETHALPPTAFEGDMMTLMAAASFALFLIWSKRVLSNNFSPYSLMAYCYIISAILFVGVSLWLGLAHIEQIPIDFMSGFKPMDWVLMGYVVLFASVISYTLNNYALTHTNPSTVAAYIFIQPVIAAILGATLLHEPFTFHMALAATVTFGGVLSATLS
ncbi:MAG: DMT family transporter [Candidatus Melainabacteria bacterium]